MVFVLAGLLVLIGLGAGYALLRSFRRSALRLQRETDEPRNDAGGELARLAENMEHMLWGMKKPLPAMSRNRLTEEKKIGPFSLEMLAIAGLCAGILLLFHGGTRPASGGGSGYINPWTIAGGTLILVTSVFGVRFDDTRRLALYSNYAEERVRVLECLERIPEALGEQAELLRVFPDWDWGWLILSRLLEKSGRLDDALSAARKASELSPEASVYIASQASLLLRMGDDSAARRLTGRLMAEFPEMVTPYLFAAELEARNGNSGRSLDLAKKAMASDAWASRDWLENDDALTNVRRLLKENGLFESGPDVQDKEKTVQAAGSWQ